MARSSEIGDLLQQILDAQGLSDRGFAAILEKRYGGTLESHRSQVSRILKGQVPRRATAIRFAEALGKPQDFFLPEPDAEVVDAALLSRIVTLLERDPGAAQNELAPLLREVADQLSELSFRLRRATEQQDADSHDA